MDTLRTNIYDIYINLEHLKTSVLDCLDIVRSGAFKLNKFFSYFCKYNVVKNVLYLIFEIYITGLFCLVNPYKNSTISDLHRYISGYGEIYFRCRACISRFRPRNRMKKDGRDDDDDDGGGTAFSSGTRRNEFRRGDRVIAYPSHGTVDYLRRLAHFHWPPTGKRKAIEEYAAEVLYKLDVSRIFPARRCVSEYRFRDRVAI